MPAVAPLIETTRGAALENQHFGAIAVADAQGRVLASAGDAHWLTFARSTIKAFQALPFMQAGGAAHFGFSREQQALLCASHSGEAMHIEQVDGMLGKAGLTRKALHCGCHLPIFAEMGIAPVPVGYDERHNNCSGKHAGFLAYCVQHGLPLEDHLALAHPLQQAIRRDVARAVGLEPGAMPMGIDGCSAPNYAMPLANLAMGYARLASGSHTEFGASFTALADAMTRHPELVSGTGRNDLAYMRAGRGDWVTKVGIDGVQVVGSKSRGHGFAVKVIDGNLTALHATTVAVLDQLGWLDARQKEELWPWRFEAIANARGTQVGERRPVFQLQRN